ncbi:MAG: lysophospholipid acyltransferase family protein [Candidatus Omnitrophota bacterium]
MDSKKIRKGIGRFFAWLALKMCSLIIRFTPRRYLYGLANGISSLGYRFVGKHRRIALESLELAFGREKSQEEREQIARDCFTFLAKSGVEIFYFMNNPHQVKEFIQIAGKDNLDKALARGRGVILVSAHFGNFPMMLCRLSAEGYRVGGIMRHMRDERAEKMFSVARNIFNIKTIYSQPRNVCVNRTLEALRNNELVFIPLDQNFGTGGVFVDFFGRSAATATGPIVLAQRTGAAVLPCFIVRQKDDRLKIIFEPAMELEEGQSPKETVLINVQKLTCIIEAYIRRFPAEWGWIHRRWKSSPPR